MKKSTTVKELQKEYNPKEIIDAVEKSFQKHREQLISIIGHPDSPILNYHQNQQISFLENNQDQNAIIDEKTKQCFIPDILCKHPLLELSLTTVTNSVNNNGDHFTGLVDMEGSVIFQQMSRHVSIHRLIFLKLVSDHMDIDDRQRIIDVTGLIAKKIDLIKSILLSLDHHVLTNNVILSDKEFDIIQRGTAQLSLTETQVHQLMEWTENYVKLTGNDLDKLAPFFIKKSNSKKERNQIFESIREFFSA